MSVISHIILTITRFCSFSTAIFNLTIFALSGIIPSQCTKVSLYPKLVPEGLYRGIQEDLLCCKSTNKISYLSDLPGQLRYQRTTKLPPNWPCSTKVNAKVLDQRVPPKNTDTPNNAISNSSPSILSKAPYHFKVKKEGQNQITEEPMKSYDK